MISFYIQDQAVGYGTDIKDMINVVLVYLLGALKYFSPCIDDSSKKDEVIDWPESSVELKESALFWGHFEPSVFQGVVLTIF